MRLFVAAELPEEMIEALAETSSLLRDGVRGRFVGSDLFHVTLAFFGEVSAYRANEVAQLVRAACEDIPVFQTTLGELGIFGRRSQAVLWQGFCTGQDAWEALARGVRAELRAGGFDLDEKGFLPHVTLMRRADVAHGALPMPCVERGTIRTVTVFSSDLSGSRPHYESLERIFLLG